MLPRFLKSLLKNDGERYPTRSINNLLNSCQRILRAHRKKLYREDFQFLIKPEPLLNVRSHPYFVHSVDCFLQAMKKFVAEGANKPRQKVGILTVEDEKLILRHPCNQLHYPIGLAKRFAFYCCSVFMVRGQSELHSMENGMFSEVLYDDKPCIRFVEIASKNYKVDLQNFQVEHFWDPLYSLHSYVINTYRALMSHMPLDIELGHHLFLQAISNPKCNIWYKKKLTYLPVVSRSGLDKWHLL